MTPITTDITPVLDRLPCGALLLGRDGRIAYANPRACGWLGRSESELRDRPLPDLVAPAGRALLAAQLETLRESLDLEVDLWTADGAVVPMMMALQPASRQPPHSEFLLATLFDASLLKVSERRAQAQYEAVARLSDTVLEQALALKSYSRELEERVRERTDELRQANMDCIYALALASEARDADTGAHVLRIQELSRRLAEAIGLSSDEAQRLGYAAILHDVGKIVIPDAIIKKPGPLTDEERLAVQRHTIEGERILPATPFFAVARRIARWHHENWDGSGYPDGLRGDAIPLEARIVHLVDVCDALLFARVYKAAWSPEQTLESLQAGAATQFDPRAVAAFERLWREDGLVDMMTSAARQPTP